MSQWAFVIAAYGLAGLATLGLLAWAYGSMRKAESAVDAIKQRR
jgi:hypothetical protein